MSSKGLLYAAKQILIAEMPMEAHQVDVRFDAKPQRWNPDVFIAIWCGQWEPGPHNQGEWMLDELIGATFTITYPVGQFPHDRIDEEAIYSACQGIEYLARRITAVLTQNMWNWICLASEMAQAELCECLPEPARDVFVAPPRWAGNDPTPRLVGPDWFSADPAGSTAEMMDEMTDSPFGVILDVRFRDAQRTQAYPHIQ